MATAYDLVSSAYQSIGNINPDAEGLAYWTNALETGAISPEQFNQTFLTAAAGVTAPEYQQAAQTARNILSGTSQPAPIDNAGFLTGSFQSQLGRDPTADEIAYYSSQINSGKLNQNQVNLALNQSLEGQNFDTQYLTSVYRQMFGRNPEQEGFQYWMSQMQSNPEMQGDMIRQWIGAAAQGIDPVKYADVMIKQQRAMELASLEADPYGGRYATTDIYSVKDGYPNISYINGRPVQFVSPVTQQPLMSQFQTGAFASQAGLDVLSAPVVDAAIKRAMASGTLTDRDYQAMFNDLSRAKSMEDVYAAFNKPRAQVVVDALYGAQVGEGKTLEEAQREAGLRTPIVQQFGSYPANFAVADALKRAGIDYAFGPEAYQGYDTMMTPENVVTPQNFQSQLNKVLDMSFGGMNFVPTNVGGGYYSERGFEPGYTPIGEAPTFRSGVAGYTPNIPTGLQFGTNVVQAPVNLFTPGQFNPLATGYTQSGEPILTPIAPAISYESSAG